MLPLGRGRYHCTASCFSSGRAQPTWIRKPLTTTPLDETQGTGSRAALLQLNALAAPLGNSADKLNLGADSRVTRLPALIRRLYNKCCRDPLEKEAHRSWWENMVTLCQAALRKGKSWPESHDRAIQEVADSGSTRTGWRSSKILDTSGTIRRAHQSGTPDPTSSSRWPGTISPKQEPS